MPRCASLAGRPNKAFTSSLGRGRSMQVGRPTRTDAMSSSVLLCSAQLGFWPVQGTRRHVGRPSLLATRNTTAKRAFQASSRPIVPSTYALCSLCRPRNRARNCWEINGTWENQLQLVRSTPHHSAGPPLPSRAFKDSFFIKNENEKVRTDALCLQKKRSYVLL